MERSPQGHRELPCLEGRETTERQQRDNRETTDKGQGDIPWPFCWRPCPRSAHSGVVLDVGAGNHVLLGVAVAEDAHLIARLRIQVECDGVPYLAFAAVARHEA